MGNVQVVSIDTLRTLAFGGISGAYAALGGPFTRPIRIICVTNNTNGDLLLSIDGTNDMLFIAASSFKLFDITSNKQSGIATTFVFQTNTQFYVKQSTAPTSGAVYLECLA